MKKLVVFAIAVIIVLILGFQNRTVLGETIKSIVYHSPCDTPTTYRIGSIDSRFNVTQGEFLGDIQEAGNIWNTAYGKNLFIYDPQGQISVSLVYDERQKLTTQISEIDKELTEKKESITPEVEEYKKRSIAFDKKVTTLNQEIDYWNSHGGASREEYKKLRDEQLALQKEAEELNKMAALLNQSTSQYNLKIRELNQTVQEYNEELKYKPEEGVYMQDSNERKIIIYFNVSKVELTHTLAHEMGHALGIMHINNISSIMYPRTTEALSLSNDDLSALNAACRKISIFETISNKANYAISIIKQQGLKGLLDNIRRSNFINPQ